MNKVGCESQHYDVVIDERIHEHIIMFMIDELPNLPLGQRYTITIEPYTPPVRATLPPESWHDGE